MNATTAREIMLAAFADELEKIAIPIRTTVGTGTGPQMSTSDQARNATSLSMKKTPMAAPMAPPPTPPANIASAGPSITKALSGARPGGSM